MTSQEQPYYQEFRDLLTRIQSAVTDLKAKNERLANENREFSGELKEVRGQLADAHREIDRLNTPSSSSLFDSLDDNGKRILRQQIVELIARIDKHLERAGSSRASENS